MITIIPTVDFISEAEDLCSNNKNLRFASIELRVFADSEIKPRILLEKDGISGQSVVILASCVGCNGRSAGDKIIEVILLADAAKRMGAKRIGLVLPYLTFSPQDKIFQDGEPLSSEVIVKMLEASAIDDFWVFDLHNEETLGLTTKPFHHLSALPLFVAHCKEIMKNADSGEEFVVASLDKGSKERNSRFAKELGLEVVEFDKTRDRTTGAVTFHGLKGDVKGKIVFSFDDYTSTGGTHIQAHEYLMEKGAKAFYLVLTHVIAEEALIKMMAAGMNVITTNSTAVDKHINGNPKLKIIDIFSTIVAEEVERVYEEKVVVEA